MNPADRKTVEDILAAALELSPEQQAAYVEQSCADSPEIRKEVEELLSAYHAAEKCIEPRAGKLALPEGFFDDAFLGTRVGTYKLVERIGDGGMGTVYRAERDDGQFTQVVAVKLVRAGLHDPELLKRLRAERQILALLEHSNIARLLDGGITAGGQPYIVMEYIEGARITDYSKSNHLNIAQRLELFRQICSAVHYAHQRLVVHRDIKPSNIVVGKDRTPKLLDFGIAKILDSSAAGLEGNTLTGLNPMTPEYASPEQIQGKVLTTATDTYSLGVLLYELLTGRKPYQTAEKTPQEIARMVCETQPQKPSTAATAASKALNTAERLESISGDLDHIVLKAMRKEPGERYASVEELSADIGNYLAGLPVRAREGSFRYLAGKFVARHKAVVALSSALLVALIAGLVLVSWEVHVARRERARAERRFNDVRKLANSLIFDVEGGIANLPGSTPVRDKVLKIATEYLDSLSKESAGDAALQVELANAYLRLGSVQSSLNSANLGDLSGSEQSYRKAQALLQSVLAKEPLRDDANGLFARSHRLLADFYVVKGQYDKAAEAAKKAMTIDQALLSRHPGDDVYLEALASAWHALGNAHANIHSPETVDDRVKALELYEQVLAHDPNDFSKQRNVALEEKTLGANLATNGSVQQAFSHYERALELDKNRAAADPLNTQAQLDVSFDFSQIGDYYFRLRDLNSALRFYQQALEIRQKLLAADPNNVQLRQRILFMQGLIANTLRELGRMEEAQKAFEDSLKSAQWLAEHSPENNAHTQYDLGFAYLGLGGVKEATASHVSARQAGLLRKQACDYFVKAHELFLPTINAGKNISHDQKQTLEDLEGDMKHCPSKASKE